MSASLPQHHSHPRRFELNRFVYPVLSRRSRGISLGINLNPDKVCNFDCIYCQVDRRSEAETRFVEIDQLLAELDDAVDLVVSGRLYEEAPAFHGVPDSLRRLNDFAFSGDGEPTTYRNFDEIVASVADLKRRRALPDVKLVLITNATMFHRPAVQRGLALLDANQGEIWAKLEAGTEDFYRLVERTTIPFQRVLDNITAAARVRPLILQSLFMRIQGAAPAVEEIDAFIQRIRDILAGGGRVASIQLYTVARPPAESFVTPLSNAELDAIAIRLGEGVQVPVERFYSA